MYVYVDIHVLTYIRLILNVHTYTHTYTCIHVCLYTYIFVYTSIAFYIRELTWHPWQGCEDRYMTSYQLRIFFFVPSYKRSNSNEHSQKSTELYLNTCTHTNNWDTHNSSMHWLRHDPLHVQLRTHIYKIRACT